MWTQETLYGSWGYIDRILHGKVVLFPYDLVPLCIHSGKIQMESENQKVNLPSCSKCQISISSNKCLMKCYFILLLTKVEKNCDCCLKTCFTLSKYSIQSFFRKKDFLPLWVILFLSIFWNDIKTYFNEKWITAIIGNPSQRLG